jgi:tRNA modification GTPase
LSGRIDLTQAEAVCDIVKAKTEYALQAGMAQLDGGLSERILEVRDGLLKVLTQLEAWIDFSAEGVLFPDTSAMVSILENSSGTLLDLIRTSSAGNAVRRGLRTVICGKPNAGKSSLLNALLRYERSIVTRIPGTTRDTVEEIIDVQGIPVRIVDTAGIIEPGNSIEKKAMLNLNRALREADLILLVFDGSRALDGVDKSLMRRLRRRKVIAVINKSDLKQRVDKSAIHAVFPVAVELSAKKARNLRSLEEAVVSSVYDGRVQRNESALMVNARHNTLLNKACSFLTHAGVGIEREFAAEYLAQDIKDALSCLDQVMGREFSLELLDRIFADFCIGK